MMNNIFAQEAIKNASMTYTENGHPVASTTGKAVLDLYGQVGALRNADEQRIVDLFKAAIGEDKLLAAKTMFYARDARGGTGEREVFRKMLKYAAIHNPELVRKNLELIPEFGRWDDMYTLVGTPLENDMFEVMHNQLMRDIQGMNEGRPISLLAKWMKSCNASSKDTRSLGRQTVKKLGFVNEKMYRKTLAELRSYIKIVEAKMSAGEWSDISYDQVPSRAGMIYRKAFKKHDEARYDEYIKSVEKGEKKINTAMNTPQDIVHAYMDDGSFRMIPKKKEDPTLEVMWKNLPDFVKSEENVLCMVDTSGSMYGRPIEVSLGLGMYFAQKNSGAFHNLFMTFESSPRFFAMQDNVSLLYNLKAAFNAPWGGSTDLNLAMKRILNFAKLNRVPQKDMPTRLIVISDMEINEAATEYSSRRIWYGLELENVLLGNTLAIDEYKKMYADAGYSMPQVIFWNVDSRHNHFHTREDEHGVMLASGSSPRVFEAVMEMKNLDITPYDAMVEVLNGERYSKVVVG